jgi:polyisoprenoid-binding protein YceI
MTLHSWNLDLAHSGVHFSVRHMVVSKVRGRFNRYAVSLQLDDADLTRSVFEATLEAASIDTGVSDRDAHLRSADFLDAERFPVLRYRSRRIERIADDRYRVVGDLTIRDVTREVELDVEASGRARDLEGQERAGFVARARLDRRDFGLRWNQLLEAGGVLVGDRVELELELEAVRAVAERAA